MKCNESLKLDSNTKLEHHHTPMWHATLLSHALGHKAAIVPEAFAENTNHGGIPNYNYH